MEEGEEGGEGREGQGAADHSSEQGEQVHPGATNHTQSICYGEPVALNPVK